MNEWATLRKPQDIFLPQIFYPTNDQYLISEDINVSSTEPYKWNLIWYKSNQLGLRV